MAPMKSCCLTLGMSLWFAWCSIGGMAPGNVAPLLAQTQTGEAAVQGGADQAASNRPPTVFWPKDVSFDPSIPTPRQFFGFDIGHRHLRHDQVVEYIQALAEATERIRVSQYGRTHGGRPLLLATITSPENHQRLPEIKRAQKSLAGPKADQVPIDELPVVMNMGYCVHGDEPSAGNCAPLVAYYLAAAQGPEVESQLRDIVVLLDPCLNPDGFDRFARWANMYRGRMLNADPAHAEHNQGWPSGRVNYYWFDLNRDWLPLVHPESRARMRWYHQWKPNVVLDFHEMGTNSSFFFQPGVPRRTHPLTPQSTVDLTGAIAKFHARAFDRNRQMYFTEEVFDDFYMGKGSTYPDLHGAIGILFEQASARGHIQESTNGILRFVDAIENQFAASRSSLEAAQAMREKLLEHQREFYRNSWELAQKSKTRVLVFTSTGNRSRLQQLANVLLLHDIQCYWTNETLIQEQRRFFPESTLLVPLRQAEYRFIQSLFERRTQFEENIFYDVSAWTLSDAYNVRKYEWENEVPLDKLTLAKTFQTWPRNLAISDDDIAYVIDWRDDRAPFWLYRCLNSGIRVKVARKPFTISSDEGNRSFHAGALVIHLDGQQDRIKAIQRTLRLAAARGCDVVPLTTAWTPQGPDIGSNHFATIPKPSIALAVEDGVRFYEAGAIWHLLDIKHSIPVSLLKSNSISRTDLSRYSTLLLPSGRYGQIADSVDAWVRQGGTLVCNGTAVEFAAGEILDLNADDTNAPDAAHSTDETSDSTPALQKPFVSARNELALALVSGAIFKGRMDPSHPLCFGFGNQKTIPVFRNHARILPPSANPYANPLIYAKQPLLAGYCSQENQDRLAQTAGIVVHSHGAGRVILIADDLNFRGFWQGTSRIYMNAIFFGSLTDPPMPRGEAVEE